MIVPAKEQVVVPAMSIDGNSRHWQSSIPPVELFLEQSTGRPDRQLNFRVAVALRFLDLNVQEERTFLDKRDSLIQAGLIDPDQPERLFHQFRIIIVKF